eukprot:scaffold34615_cov180-Amphora_coffeaeformis.AAC.1
MAQVNVTGTTAVFPYFGHSPVYSIGASPSGYGIAIKRKDNSRRRRRCRRTGKRTHRLGECAGSHGSAFSRIGRQVGGFLDTGMSTISRRTNIQSWNVLLSAEPSTMHESACLC